MQIVARYFTLCVLAYTYALQKEGCKSPQYITVGGTENINCVFYPGFYGLFWYNSTDIIKDEAIFNFRGSVKSGTGYTSGKLDIHKNGSLSIKNVSLNDDGLYTVVKFNSPTNYSSPITVRVVTVVQPYHAHPLIESCSNGDVICLKQIPTDQFQVSCRVRNSKPSVDLYWAVRTLNGDRNASIHSSISTEANLLSTRVTTTNTSRLNSSLILFVCKAVDPYSLLEQDESFLLLQRKSYDTAYLNSERKYLELNSRLILECSENEMLHLIWKKREIGVNTFKNLLFTVFTKPNFTRVLTDGYDVNEKGSLLLGRVTPTNEGFYYCLYSDGITDDQIAYEVIVYAKPVPYYPVVKGCNNDQYCVLETGRRGNLTCTISRIRPLVQLEWRIFDKNSANQISLLPREQVIKTNGETVDISVSTLYEIDTNLLNRLTLECRVVGSNLELFHLSTKFDLLFSNGTAEISEGPKAVWWIIIIITLTAAFLAILLYCVWRRQKQKTRDKNRTKGSSRSDPKEEETLPMVVEEARKRNELRPVNVTNPSGGTLPLAGGPTVYSTLQDGLQSPSVTVNGHQHYQDRMQEFVKYLKKKYAELYQSVQPIPYERDKMYSVGEVFVEGGIQVLRYKDKFTGNEDWENLTSHEDVFQSLGVEPSIHILEGEPGYGKSMLALLIACAWCSSKSPFSKINILIVLRLRQLEGFTSIFSAIKMFLLPKDSDFSEEEIESILKSSESGMIILDGLDEYPDKDMEAPSDILDIIKGNMLQKCEVLLTTRTSCLPKKYPRRTKRERLTGFDKCARRCYLLKAVVNNDNDKANEIEEKLRGNPVLHDICQVPLCFVLFAHIIYEKHELATCDSVTKFFHFVISCFHSHMKNKMEDDNVKRLELFENHHRDLDEAAFDSLTQNQGQIVWDRQELLSYVHSSFYEQYVRIGILLEEEVLQIQSKPGVFASDHIKYKTSVSFYHKLFCEWYASHYLAKYIEEHAQENLTKVFNAIDPFNLQYVYRFACGLSSHAARHIIKHLEANDETKHFAILCTMEDIESFDTIKERILQMCNKVEVTESQSLLLRRSVIRLLEVASAHKIMVKILSIRNCFRSFDEDENNVILQPDFSLSVLKSLKELHLSERGREMTVQETEDILKYISLCEALDNLRLYNCLMPRLNTVIPCLSVLQSRDVKVAWYPTTSVYRLNFATGTWGFKESTPITNNEYSKLIREFRLTYQETDWQKARVRSETK